MPSRNIIKIDIPESYYHVYARGHNRQLLFRDEQDYRVFLNLFKRHLSPEVVTDNYGKAYAHLRGQLELLCYCLMPNHFHLLVFQNEQGAMQRLMRSIMTTYSRYFNKKYQSSGSPFESSYKASRISSEDYLMHISRYIHLNPGNWMAHPYSSIHAYFGVGQPEWLQQGRVVELFESLPVYADFLDDYKDYKKSFDQIKHELAQ